MKEGNNYGLGSDNSDDIKGSNEEVNGKVGNVLHDTVILSSNIDTGNDFRALGRIKLEDLEVQESILEFEGEFDKFIVQQAGDYGYVQENESEQDILNSISVNENFEVEESLLQKILDFFRQLYQNSEEVIGFDYELDPLRRRKKKKKFILESIIEFLKKLLRNGQSLNLKELLDKQILELQEELSNELDPALRKLLQERLMLLSELRSQLMGIGINSRLLFNFFMLSSLVNTVSALQQDAASTRKSAELDETMGLLVHGKDIHSSEQGAFGSQVSNVSDPSNVLFVQCYIPGVLYGKMNELPYKLHDQYFFIQRDMSFHTMPNIGIQRGIILAIIMRVIDTVVSKVKSVVKEAINMLDRAPYRQYSKDDASNVKPFNPSSYSYIESINFSQGAVLDTQQVMGRLSLLSYNSEIRFSYTSQACSTYVQEIQVTQVEVHQSSVVGIGRMQ
ncbi:hypothetical protein K6025_03925 [Ehrlichia sp. JZT12]